MNSFVGPGYDSVGTNLKLIRYPFLGSDSVPTFGPLLFKIRKRDPFLGSEIGPIFGVSICDICWSLVKFLAPPYVAHRTTFFTRNSNPFLGQ